MPVVTPSAASIDTVKAVPFLSPLRVVMGGSCRRSQRPRVSVRQIRPRPNRAMKLMYSALTWSAASTRSPSFSRSSSSTRMTMRPARMSATMSSTGEMATGVSDLLVMGVDVIGPARRLAADAGAAVRKGAGCGPWVDSRVSVALRVSAQTPGREPGRQATVCHGDAGSLFGSSRMNRQTPIIAAKPTVQHGGHRWFSCNGCSLRTQALQQAVSVESAKSKTVGRGSLHACCLCVGAGLLRDRVGPRQGAARCRSLTGLFGLGGFSAGGLALGAGSLLLGSAGLGRSSCLAVGGVHFTSGESVDGHQLNQSHTHGKNHFFHTFLQKSELVSERPEPDACTFCCACQSTSGSPWPNSQAQ